MAMVKLSGDVVDINGKVGGNIYRTDVCGQHVQASPRKINQREPSPQKGAFVKAKNAWSTHVWLEPEINEWWIWCYNHPKKNKKGEVMYLHPFLAFLSINMKRIIRGRDIIYKPTR